MRPGRLTATAVGALLIGLVAGCHSSSTTAAKAGTCLASTVQPVGASPAAPTPVASPLMDANSARRLLDMSYGCLDGSGDVRLSSVGRPMIVTMWATWCAPCRVEAPSIESFAQAAGGAVAVVGVDTDDGRGAGQSFVSDAKLTYPMLSDPNATMLHSVPPGLLPTLLFVTADGQIAGSLSSNKVTVATLKQLVSKYFAVILK